MRFLCALFCVFAALPALQAQPYVEGGQTRHRFAQTHIGVGGTYAPGGNTVAWQADRAGFVSASLSSAVTPSMTVGGLHFWGHANFFVRFPLATVQDRTAEATFSPGVETGGAVFPLQLEEGTVRPYAGVTWSLISFRQQGWNGERGPLYTGHRLQPQAGLVWWSPFGLIDAGIRLVPGSRIDYPVSSTEVRTVELPAWTVSLGYSLPFETTLSAEALAEGGRDRMIEERLGEQGRLDGPTVGVGLSSAFTTTRTGAVFPSAALDVATPPAMFPEISLGYYHHGLDAAANVVYRAIGQEQEGYGHAQEWSRKTVTVEAVKFLADYNGFVPFVGAMLSYDHLDYSERAPGERRAEGAKDGVSAGVVLGWDIRPNRLQSFLIRTSVRYTPSLSLEPQPGGRAMFDHLEVNFFHLVLFPTRIF